VAHVIVDTSALLAYFDASEPDHAAVAETMTAITDLLIVSPYWSLRLVLCRIMR
jgi:predicted nucleic acid-binding protein